MSPLTQEQQRQRRRFLGASEVATALGLMPDSDVYSRPIDVWLEKTGAERVTPINRTATTAGNRLEPVVRDWYAELAAVKLKSIGSIVHPEHDWIGCTPDSVVVEHHKPIRNVQVKCVGGRAMFDWGGQSAMDDDDGSLILSEPDGIPDYYRVQCEWEMGALHARYGVNETHLVALLGGTDLRVYVLRRDVELWQSLFDAAHKFWHDHVVADVPPPPDGSLAFKRYLERRFPKATREDLDPMPADIEDLAAKYLRVSGAIKKASASKDKLGNELRSRIEDRAGYISGICKVQWRNTKTGRALDVRERKQP